MNRLWPVFLFSWLVFANTYAQNTESLVKCTELLGRAKKMIPVYQNHESSKQLGTITAGDIFLILTGHYKNGFFSNETWINVTTGTLTGWVLLGENFDNYSQPVLWNWVCSQSSFSIYDQTRNEESLVTCDKILGRANKLFQFRQKDTDRQDFNRGLLGIVPPAKYLIVGPGDTFEISQLFFDGLIESKMWLSISSFKYYSDPISVYFGIAEKFQGKLKSPYWDSMCVPIKNPNS